MPETGSSQWAQGNQNVQIHDVAEGATISVTFDRSRRRLPLQPAVVPPGTKVSSPARLLRARSGMLPFVPRAGLLDDLRVWMADVEPFSAVRVLPHVSLRVRPDV